MSAFFLFSQGNRVNVKEEFPEASFGEVVSHFGDILSVSESCSWRFQRSLLCFWSL
jgi:hypothetical protein